MAYQQGYGIPEGYISVTQVYNDGVYWNDVTIVKGNLIGRTVKRFF